MRGNIRYRCILFLEVEVDVTKISSENLHGDEIFVYKNEGEKNTMIEIDVLYMEVTKNKISKKTVYYHSRNMIWNICVQGRNGSGKGQKNEVWR